MVVYDRKKRNIKDITPKGDVIGWNNKHREAYWERRPEWV